MAFPGRVSQRADPRRVEAPSQADVLSQERIDALLISNSGRHGDVVLRSMGEQAPNQHPGISQRGMGPSARGTIPIIRGTVHGEEDWSLSIGALGVDRRSKFDKVIDQ